MNPVAAIILATGIATFLGVVSPIAEMFYCFADLCDLFQRA